MAAVIFAGGVAILIVGFLWFYIARPMLEDFGLITVNDYEDDALHVMSRSEDAPAPSIVSAVQTDNAQTTDRQSAPAFSREVMLNTFRMLRKYGVPREEARAILKGLGAPLDNNLWTQAAPDDDVLVTPYAGRRTRASYYPDDPELEYKSPV